MREVSECWVQDPAILREEIQVRQELLKDMVGTLYPRILEDQISQLEEILARRLREIAEEQVAKRLQP